eukprot:CAMPEP_0119567390 /NCGR_PEP_ID=MMETSP1352-20130426/35805_1 /TAXON_ID=265584 /ORGANISM="Stauroneis constricta, Strain CCMP1120" /LENGTH=184 /DNA_ID=CAMNT_0007616643 /DNA_START=6 /DNA_END=557 /DNA_ORIENTATION=+
MSNSMNSLHLHRQHAPSTATVTTTTTTVVSSGFRAVDEANVADGGSPCPAEHVSTPVSPDTPKSSSELDRLGQASGDAHATADVDDDAPANDKGFHAASAKLQDPHVGIGIGMDMDIEEKQSDDTLDSTSSTQPSTVHEDLQNMAFSGVMLPNRSRIVSLDRGRQRITSGRDLFSDEPAAASSN